MIIIIGIVIISLEIYLNSKSNIMEAKENIQFMDKVVASLRKAADEVEEFQAKAAIGKTEAQEKFEEIKGKFNLFMDDSKVKLKLGKEKLDDLDTKFDELRVQLALGKAETVEIFKKQKKELLLTLHDIEVKIKNNETLNRMYAFVLIEIEKFKVHLEVLEQKFDHSKKEAKTSFVKRKEDFSHFIDGIKDKYSKKDESKWEHFQGEMSEAFVHLKQAFSKS